MNQVYLSMAIHEAQKYFKVKNKTWKSRYRYNHVYSKNNENCNFHRRSANFKFVQSKVLETTTVSTNYLRNAQEKTAPTERKKKLLEKWMPRNQFDGGQSNEQHSTFERQILNENKSKVKWAYIYFVIGITNVHAQIARLCTPILAILNSDTCIWIESGRTASFQV